MLHAVLTNAVRRSFYNLLLAQKTIKVASDNLEHYREILRVNEIRLKVGDVAEMDFVRIEVESLKVQSDQDQARAALNQARADLLLLLGWPENSIEINAVEAWPEASPEIALTRQDHLIQTRTGTPPGYESGENTHRTSAKNAHSGATADHSRCDHKRFL